MNEVTSMTPERLAQIQGFAWVWQKSGDGSDITEIVVELLAHIEAQAKQIVEEREATNVAYQVGFHKRDDEVRKLKSQIEQLEKDKQRLAWLETLREAINNAKSG